VGKHRKTELAGAEDEDRARGGGWGFWRKRTFLGVVLAWKWKTNIGKKGTKDLRNEKMKMEYGGSQLL
jgi:hypothetical protein